MSGLILVPGFLTANLSARQSHGIRVAGGEGPFSLNNKVVRLFARSRPTPAARRPLRTQLLALFTTWSSAGQCRYSFLLSSD